ncbi:MAG: flippase-like domain-containing protein [Crocinitomicaceae bacterium]|nr:flippase-like domain-containing protein [Crocinitomicaceae bacterium]
MNWGLETLKWRMLLNAENDISFSKSYKLVLAGITTGIMTPNRLGNFVGRVYDKDINDRENAIVATFLSNISQFMATILIGLVALYLLPQQLNNEVNKTVIFSIAGILQLLSFIVFIVPNNKVVSFFTSRFLPKYQKKIDDLAELPLSKKLLIFFVAILRYSVIVIQFYLVLLVFIEGLELEIWVGIALTFLLTTIIPSVAFGKLFVREASAILILSIFLIPIEIILSCTFILWCFNLAIPALLGMRFLYKK